MSKRLLKMAGFLVADFLIALLLLQAYFGWYRGLLFVDRGSEHPDWLNITPGYADTIPDLFLTHYSPWVLPREQNFSSIAGVSIQPGRPIVLKGKPNQVRYWSFVFYPANAAKHTNTLPSLDSSRIELDPDGSYVVTLSPTKVSKNWIDTGDAPAIYYGDQLMRPAKEYDHAP
jgi:hypothetical protein